MRFFDRVDVIGIGKVDGKFYMKTCPSPAENEYRQGECVEIAGTPTIFHGNGRMIRGYFPAPLLGMLGLDSKPTGMTMR
ncbi:MAG: hypothetical protein ACYC9L_05725 [Sulfuricaulis sp.]